LALEDYPAAEPRLLTNDALKQMLNALVTDLMQTIFTQAHELGLETLEHLRRAPLRLAHLSESMEAQRKQIKAFLFANLYMSPILESEHQHAIEVIQTLFAEWTADPRLLPPDHLARVAEQGAPRAVADYIAGMTDAYIEQAWLTHIGGK